MEEWVGERWHRFIWRAADASHAHMAVRLDDVQRSVQMLFRAGGGDALVRVVPATAERIGGPRGWLQKLAGQGGRAALSTLDGETLALPPVIAVFSDRELNRDLYLWLAVQGACLSATGNGWLADNIAATRRALEQFPGLRTRYERLAQAHLAQRPDPAHLRGAAQAAEQAIQDTLHGTLAGRQDALGCQQRASNAANAFVQPERHPCARSTHHSTDASPVWLWLQSHMAIASDPAALSADTANAEEQDKSRGRTDKPVQQDAKRRRAQRSSDSSSKSGLLMFFRAESILSWSEFVRVNRTGDDEDNQDYSQVADDMEHLHLAHRKPGETLAARVKFDLDLPSAAADDLLVDEGEPLPEWDFRQQRLVPERCRVQRMRARMGSSDGAPLGEAAALLPAPDAQLQRTSRQVRRRVEALRAASRWQHALPQGDELDLDAWVRHQVDRCDTRRTSDELPAVYARRVRTERSLATLILADLSLSTDAYATQTARVVDLIRDSLFVFADALHALGDAFEMLGFSSVRRHVRIHELKRFSEPWNDAARQRVAAIKPGFYTRMGAAIRWGTQRLHARPERQRLLLILTDGKPNDLDQYEGRWGLEDTRHAVLAARAAGLEPFCVTIDQNANAYLPRLFGARGYALVHRPAQLANALSHVYVRLTAATR